MLRSDVGSVWTAPRLRLLANGQEIAGPVEAEVLSNNHYAADRFSAVIAAGADPFIGVGFWAAEPDIILEVQFSIDAGESFVSLIQGAIDNVAIDPANGLVHLDGRDLTAALIEARTQETFANRTASEIATLLAARHNLSASVTATSTPVGRYYQNEHDSITLDQFSRATTEWDLLVFLARQEGFDVFVEGTALHFQPAGPPAAAAVAVRPTDVISLRLERSLTLARDIEVVVKSWNSREGSAFVQRARATRRVGGKGTGEAAPVQRYVFVRPNLTPDAALKLAQQKLAELTRHERVIDVVMAGDLVLTPRSTVMLVGTGCDFDQLYYVDTIERRLRYDGGFTQRVRAKNTSPRTQTTPPTADILAA